MPDIQKPDPDYFPTIEILQDCSQQLSAHVVSTYNSLQEILKAHETEVNIIWLILPLEARKNVHLAAWPEIPKRHRPDWEYWDTVPEKRKVHDAPVPYINLEDLVISDTLLVFLRARGHHHPANFAQTELDHCRFNGHQDVDIWRKYCQHCMVFHVDGTKYAEIQFWEEQTKAVRLWLAGQAIHPARGMEVLNIQYINISFLISCCRALLEYDGRSVARVSSCLSPPSQTADMGHFRINALEAPYRAPGPLDLKRLEDLISAKSTTGMTAS